MTYVWPAYGNNYGLLSIQYVFYPGPGIGCLFCHYSSQHFSYNLSIKFFAFVSYSLELLTQTNYIIYINYLTWITYNIVIIDLYRCLYLHSITEQSVTSPDVENIPWSWLSHAAMASGKVLYSIAVVVLGFICFVVGAIAVGLPSWGYFKSCNFIFLLSLFKLNIRWIKYLIMYLKLVLDRYRTWWKKISLCKKIIYVQYVWTM